MTQRKRYIVIVAFAAALACARASAAMIAHLDFEAVSPNKVPGARLTSEYLIDYYDFRLNPIEANWKKYRFSSTGGGTIPLLKPSDVPTVLHLHTGPTPENEGKDRVEFVLNRAIAADEEYFLAFNVYIPYDGTKYTSPDNWFIIVQLRQNGGHSQSPSLSIDYTQDGALAVVARSDEDGYRQLIKVPVSDKRNRWLYIKLRFRMGEAGLVQAFIEDEWSQPQYFDLRWDSCNPPCTDTWSLGFGIYRGKTTQPIHLEFDNVILYDSAN